MCCPAVKVSLGLDHNVWGTMADTARRVIAAGWMRAIQLPSVAFQMGHKCTYPSLRDWNDIYMTDPAMAYDKNGSAIRYHG